MQPDQKRPSAIRDLVSFSRPVIGFLCVPFLLTPTPEGLTLVCSAIAAALLIHFMTTASAQRRGTDEDLRMILDPATESIFHFTIYIGLMLAGWFPIWALFVCYAGDLLVPYLCVLGRQRGLNIVYRPSLTLRTATHAIVQTALILPHVSGGFVSSGAISGSSWLPCLAVMATIAAVIDYSIAIIRPRAGQ